MDNDDPSDFYRSTEYSEGMRWPDRNAEHQYISKRAKKCLLCVSLTVLSILCVLGLKATAHNLSAGHLWWATLTLACSAILFWPVFSYVRDLHQTGILGRITK